MSALMQFQSAFSSSVDSRPVLGLSQVSLVIHEQASVHGMLLVL